VLTICDNKLVNFVAMYAAWYGCVATPLGYSVFQCGSRYDFKCENFMSLN